MDGSELREKMKKSVDAFYEQVKGLRYGTVTPSLVDTVKVKVYGQQTPIRHLAATSKIDSGVSVVPYDSSLVGQVSNALKSAGFNAYTFSKTTVMVSVPPPSGEEKERVKKRIRELGEDAKVSIRNIRKKAKKEIGESLSLTTLQAITDEYIGEIDELVKHKSESI